MPARFMEGLAERTAHPTKRLYMIPLLDAAQSRSAMDLPTACLIAPSFILLALARVSWSTTTAGAHNRALAGNFQPQMQDWQLWDSDVYQERCLCARLEILSITRAPCWEFVRRAQIRLRSHLSSRSVGQSRRTESFLRRRYHWWN